MVIKTKTGEIDFSKLHAQQIFRSQVGGKQYIFALVRRKYGPNDVETTGPGEYIGISEEPVYRMTTNNNPDSDSYGERVPEESITYTGSGKEIRTKIQTGTDWRPQHEATPKTLKDYRSMVGSMPKPIGDTQFYWIFKEGKIPAEDEGDFFEMNMDEVRSTLLKSKSIRTKKPKKASGENEE